MNLRSALLAAAALAIAFWTSLTLCRWRAGENPDLAAIGREVQRGEDLAPHIEAGQRRDETRRSLAAEVVAGRLSLREAVGSFRRLDEADPGYPAGIPRAPGDERFFCGRVLDFVREILGREGRYAAAARWYGEAFTAHPYLLAGPPSDHRYNAARAAALAGCEQGGDAAGLEEATRAGFRNQALGWLRAELEARQRLLEQQPEKTRWIVAYDMHRWLEDPDFAGVRGPEALARLPAAERQEWQQLWAAVADMLARAQGAITQRQKAGSRIPVPER
jgi:hypothetical protein